MIVDLATVRIKSKCATFMPAPSFIIENTVADLVKLGLPKGAGEFTPDQLFTLRSLGWNLNRIHQALTTLRARVQNETLSPLLVEFLRPLLREPTEKPPQKLDLRIAWNHSNLTVDFSSLPSDTALDLALFWLPALSAFWERTLRRAAFQRTRQILPRAWFLIATDPPPGAVIPGLDRFSWSEFQDSNENFWRVQHGTKTSISTNALQEASAEADEASPIILIAQARGIAEHTLNAHYANKGRRSELHSLRFF